MKRQKSDIYSLLGQTAKRSNLNIDDLIYQFKMRKCNNRLAKQYSEIIKIFDHKQSPKTILSSSGLADSKQRQLRLKTDESSEPLQQRAQRHSNQLDIHQIIRETSPVKITPRLNYENFTTFQESVQNSEESKQYSSSLAKFGPSSSNQCETDEEIQQISKQSVQKLSKFKHIEVFEQNAIKICQQIENKNTKLIKQGFHMIKIFSQWTVKEKATNLFIGFFERQMHYYFDLLLIYEKSIDGRRSLNYDSDDRNSTQFNTQKKEPESSVLTPSVLTPISINLPTFSSPNQIKTTNQFGVINFEEYLKKQKKIEQ